MWGWGWWGFPKKTIATFGYKQWLLSLDMKTKVVQHVPRINLSHLNFSKFQMFQNFKFFKFSNFSNFSNFFQFFNFSNFSFLFSIFFNFFSIFSIFFNFLIFFFNFWTQFDNFLQCDWIKFCSFVPDAKRRFSHSVWKFLKVSHFNFPILAFLMIFCPLKK